MFRWKNRETYSAHGNHTASYMNQLKVNSEQCTFTRLINVPDQKQRIGFSTFMHSFTVLHSVCEYNFIFPIFFEI